MEDIRFIKEITEYVYGDKYILGNCVYFDLGNGNKAKTCCYTAGVKIEIINGKEGKIDWIDLPFSHYFAKTRCSPTSPSWHQHIDNGYWYFEKMYRHVVPTEEDYKSIASAISCYLNLFS